MEAKVTNLMSFDLASQWQSPTSLIKIHQLVQETCCTQETNFRHKLNTNLSCIDLQNEDKVLYIGCLIILSIIIFMFTTSFYK